MRADDGWPEGTDVGRLYPSAQAAVPNSDTAYAESRHPTHTLSRNRSLRSRALKPSPDGRGLLTRSLK